MWVEFKRPRRVGARRHGRSLNSPTVAAKDTSDKGNEISGIGPTQNSEYCGYTSLELPSRTEPISWDRKRAGIFRPETGAGAREP